jgi:hypothetical protein
MSTVEAAPSTLRLVLSFLSNMFFISFLVVVSCFDLSIVVINDISFLVHGLDWLFLLDILGGLSAWTLLRSALPLLLLFALLLEFFLLISLELSYLFDIALQCVVIRVLPV